MLKALVQSASKYFALVLIASNLLLGAWSQVTVKEEGGQVAPGEEAFNTVKQTCSCSYIDPYAVEPTIFQRLLFRSKDSCNRWSVRRHEKYNARKVAIEKVFAPRFKMGVGHYEKEELHRHQRIAICRFVTCPNTEESHQYRALCQSSYVRN